MEVSQRPRSSDPVARPRAIVVDAHVHVHACFDPAALLDAAADRFAALARCEADGLPWTGLLMLTEMQGETWFAERRSALTAGETTLGRWTLAATAEPESLCAVDADGRELCLLAGRQVVTSEGLEVLALAVDRPYADGQPLPDTVAAIAEAGGLPVLPWAAGKWTGKRGQTLRAYLAERADGDSGAISGTTSGAISGAISGTISGATSGAIYLGDNSGRPQFWSRPPAFQEADRWGVKILPGTDPLPLPGEEARVGSFGFWLAADRWDGDRPAASLKTLLAGTSPVRSYGSLESPLRFVRNQVALRTGGGKAAPRGQTQMAGAAEGLQSSDPTAIAAHGYPETADIETATDAYASRFAGELGHWLLAVQNRGTLKLLAPDPGATVLDVGGGHGQNAGLLANRGYRVTVFGSDPSCQHRIRDLVAAGRCNFQTGNVLQLPYPDDAFDVVVSYRFLAHVTRWEEFLAELSRVAAKAVVLDYSTTRSANAIAPLLFKFKKGLEKNTRPFICYREGDIVAQMAALGWQPRDRFPQFFWPMALHRGFKSPVLSAALETPARLTGLTALFGSPVLARFEPKARP